MGQPWSLLRLFLSFQTNIAILQQIYVKNVHPVFGAGIQTHNKLRVTKENFLRHGLRVSNKIDSRKLSCRVR